MCIFSKDLFFSIFSTKPAYLLARVTIVPDPSDAVVTLTAPGGYSQKGNYIEVPIGTIVSYKVEKQKLKPSEDEVLVVGNTTIPVKLFEPIERRVTIETTPSDASVIFVGNGIVEQGAKSVKAAAGSVLSYTVSDPKGELSLTESGSLTVQTDEVISVTMRTKAHITKVSPPDAVVKINGELGSYRELPCNQVIKVSVTRDGYDPFNPTLEKNNRGIVPDFISEVELKETTYILTVESTPTNASLSVVVGGKTYTETGKVTVDNVLPGTSIKATATLSGYDSVTETFNMPASNYGKTLSLNETEYTLTIMSTPAAATITVMLNGKQAATGTGKVVAKTKKGVLVDYTVAYGEKEEIGSFNMPAADYARSIVLNAMGDDVVLLTASEKRKLPAGRYKVILVTSGGNGGDGMSVASSRDGLVYGGGGGGSGYVGTDEFVSDGSEYQFNVSTKPYEISSIYKVHADGGLQLILGAPETGGDGYNGYETTAAPGTGGNGRNGGGGGGKSVSKNSTTFGSGGGGGTRRGNGANGVNGGRGGYGENNVIMGIDSNGGNVSSSLGQPGKGGRGLVSIQQTLLNPSEFSSVTFLTLQNLISGSLSGGGGGGGQSTLGETYSTAGGGGGGGGWFNGGDAYDSGTASGCKISGGRGGGGAILYLRVAWS